ncbi:MAG TPA: hypothetical protein VHP58_06370 [Alphaproteobacteria bacterium]|nr:hypothetical protein [Alphaproteobacteria bacterium]
MLNFPVHRNDPLAKRLNALLLPHAVAPFHIKEQLMKWHEQGRDDVSDLVRLLRFYRETDQHLMPLFRHQYADLREADFNDLQAATELDAEYGLLRRYTSLNHTGAMEILTPADHVKAREILGAMHVHVANYAWSRDDMPRFRSLVKIDGSPLGREHEPWMKALSAHHANERGTRH